MPPPPPIIGPWVNGPLGHRPLPQCILLISMCMKSERNNETNIHLYSPQHFHIIELYFSIDFSPRDAVLAWVFATATCLSVWTSVRPSVCHTPVLCLTEQKQDRETPHHSSFWEGMTRRKIREGSHQRNVPNEGGLGFFGDFRRMSSYLENGAF